jgi:dihydroorotase
MKRIVIKGGRVIDPAHEIDAIQDVYISDGKIVGVHKPPAGFTADQEISAKNKVVCPGFIDLMARLREPGFEYKATIATETYAAASAGITTLCCPPDTFPVVDHPAIVEFIEKRAHDTGKARIVTLGALTKGLQGLQLAEMAALKNAGCVGVSNAHMPVSNTAIQRNCFEYASTLGLTVFINAEDSWLANEGCVHEGAISTRLGLQGISTSAESIAVARDLILMEETGARVHFSQLSSGHAVDLVALAQARGLPVTADVAAHQLHLTELDVSEFNAQCHVRPVLRTLSDQHQLKAGIKQGTLQAICSDHQPHEADAKLQPFASTAPGISSLETMLPLTLRLVAEGLITLKEAIATLTINPARILGIDRGHFAVGAVADVCVFDPSQEWTLDKDKLLSKGHNTPFHGWLLHGRVECTLLNGKIVYKR